MNKYNFLLCLKEEQMHFLLNCSTNPLPENLTFAADYSTYAPAATCVHYDQYNVPAYSFRDNTDTQPDCAWLDHVLNHVLMRPGRPPRCQCPTGRRGRGRAGARVRDGSWACCWGRGASTWTLQRMRKQNIGLHFTYMYIYILKYSLLITDDNIFCTVNLIKEVQWTKNNLPLIFLLKVILSFFLQSNSS